MNNSEEIKKCYEEIYNGCIGKQFKRCKEKFTLDQLSHFTAMSGPEYGENGFKKMMLIGRAVNGWMKYQDINDAEDFGQKSLDAMIKSKFSWVVQDKNGKGLRNGPEDDSTMKNESEKRADDYYYLDKSPFWRVAKNIFSKVTGIDSNGKWVDYIAWSNLYKVSFYDTGNPSWKMMKAQLSGCRNLLKQEIETYQPDFILMVVGWDWFELFNNGSIFQSVKFIDRNKYKGNDTNGVYVEATAVYVSGTKEIPVIITCRPEFRDETKFVEDVLKEDMIKNLTK